MRSFVTGIDVTASSVVLAVLLATIVAYAVRVVLSGAAHFARVDAAGSSPLLGKHLMEAGYWGLQPIARGLIAAGISADTITLLSLAIAAGGGVALAMGHFGIAAAATIVAALGDALDGLVARETGTASKAGALLDAAVDRYEEFFFLGGLAFYYRANTVVLALVLLALLGSFMVSYGSAKAEALRVEAPRGAMRRAERAVYLGAGALLTPLAGALTIRFALPEWVAEAPMLAAIAVVGVVSNVSAALRLRAIAISTEAPPAPRVQAPKPVRVLLEPVPASSRGHLRSGVR